MGKMEERRVNAPRDGLAPMGQRKAVPVGFTYYYNQIKGRENEMSTILNETLHTAAQALRTPVVIVLLLILVITAACVGSILVELFSEHRRLRRRLPLVLQRMKEERETDEVEIVKESGLLRRQREGLLEVIGEQAKGDEATATAAQLFLTSEQIHYQKTATLTDAIVKLGPVFGLLGTLIPLGPGITALAQGDVTTLSNSMLLAFDTTIAGVLAAGICFLISVIRKQWYQDYFFFIESLLDAIMDRMEEGVKQ